MSVVRHCGAEYGPPASSPAAVFQPARTAVAATPHAGETPAVHKAAGALVGAALSLALIAAPARAQTPEASQAQDLSNCAGAVAAFAGFDIMVYPAGVSGVWGVVLGDILTALNREPGVEGMTGRYAASAARSFWAERPRAEQEEAATRCRARFGSQ